MDTAGVTMTEIPRANRRYFDILMRCLPILAFVIPLSILYYLDPNSFEMTWEGRTYYLFFVWLMILETILNWEELRPKIWKLKSTRTILLILLFSLPTIYVIGSNYWRWNGLILDFAKRSINPDISIYQYMPLSIEYLVFTSLFVAIAFAAYGVASLRNYSITAVFIGLIGSIYTTNNLYPYGLFTPFQVLVPMTTALAAGILNMMGYRTSISIVQSSTQGSMPVLSIGHVAYAIAWPCSGIDSLLIYSVTILLFLKSSAIPWKQRIGYFLFGAIITYLINGLRIATIFVIGVNGGDINPFHDYYGPLYSISWIISYPLIILATRSLWTRIVPGRTGLSQGLRVSGLDDMMGSNALLLPSRFPRFRLSLASSKSWCSRRVERRRPRS
jgi:exosortase/archaeosortase family protein